MITEKEHENKLRELGINIKTKYMTDNGILERNTDHSKNDNILEGIVLLKEYYYKNNKIHTENIFDSRILYSYVFNKNEEEVKCPNCGNLEKIDSSIDGCPYCGTCYNIDYENKNLGSKYYYDLKIKDKSYIIKTFIIDLVVSFIVSLIFIVKTGRTFTIFDMSKVLIGTFFIGTLLFFFFYYMDAFIILSSLKRKKEQINQKQIEFWNKMKKIGIDKKAFYNNLNYDLRNYYYTNKSSIIDYDILDYNSFDYEEINGELFVNVDLDIRLVEFIDGKIKPKLEKKKYRFKKVKVDKMIDKSINIINCPNCGASIDVTKNECEYCGTKINYLQEWYLVKVWD